MSNDLFQLESEAAPKKPHYSDHRKRLRKRFISGGTEGMHDYELLELLLAYAIPRRDVKPAKAPAIHNHA